MNSELQAVIGRIIIQTKVTSSERIALITRVTTDYANLSSRALAGEDVETELALVQASVLNLDRATRKVIGDQLSQWISATLQSVLINLIATE